MKKSILTAAVLATVIGLAAASARAEDNMAMSSGKGDMEKCYGVASKGNNDCKTAAHACAGHSAKGGSKHDFISVPTGLCTKLNHGSTTDS